MKVRDALDKIGRIRIPHSALPVEKTVAQELAEKVCPQAAVVEGDVRRGKAERGELSVAVLNGADVLAFFPQKKSGKDRDWVAFHLEPGGGGLLAASQPSFLYMAFSYLEENLIEKDMSEIEGRLYPLTFSREKSTFDLFLTQYARLIQGFNRESYIREYARLGFTHIEVNALAFDHPAEEGVPGEFYSEFYTYCPALDQFVSSSLNRGTYEQDYLEANLALLKRNAELAERFGLVPGLLCFEPRSVPEDFYRKYPTLRGARVDHPFRSFKPRYSLALAHPLARRHYEELIAGLLDKVPQLGFLTIWSNDSGAGFEHTRSLYAGRNGGAYLIREWKTDDEIARASSGNILGFFELLQQKANSIRPGFRIITRLESFYGERRFLWQGLKNGVDVEANSLLTQGWESRSFHPSYGDIPVLGSALHNSLPEEEKKPLQELRRKKSRSYFYHYLAAHGNHEPLLGIPFPWLVHDKLNSCARLGIDSLAHVGGLQPPEKVPWAVNQEVFRRFQLDSELDIDLTIAEIAEHYVGPEFASALVQSWRKLDLSVRCFVPLSIYTHYGVVWQRLFVRPLVPDIDRIPENERAYYEDFMCTSFHNPNKVDLSRDVLFELVSPAYALNAVELIDANVWGPLETALQLIGAAHRSAQAKNEIGAGEVFADLMIRARALRCLFRTLRNTAVWIAEVHRYVNNPDPEIRKECLGSLKAMIDSEIGNSRDLIALWADAPAEWMIVSGGKETPFIYGKNFPELLEQKIQLMEKYGGYEPHIDSEYMFRIKNKPFPPDDEENMDQGS